MEITQLQELVVRRQSQAEEVADMRAIHREDHTVQPTHVRVVAHPAAILEFVRQ